VVVEKRAVGRSGKAKTDVIKMKNRSYRICFFVDNELLKTIIESA